MENDGMRQHEALIRHWLHQEPADAAGAFVAQAAQALWLEKRHYESLGRVLGGGRKRT